MPTSPTTPCTAVDEPWQEDVFCPSANFRHRAQIRSKAFNTRDTVQGTYVNENNWLRSWSYETYLWYDEIEDVDPACCTTPKYFGLMKTNETTSSGKPKDRFHFSRSTREYRQHFNEGITVGYGARFKVLQSTPPRNVVVRNTEPGSPATATGVNLVRGTQILGVDGIDIVNSTNADNVRKNKRRPLSVGWRSHTFTVKDPGSSSRSAR